MNRSLIHYIDKYFVRLFGYTLMLLVILFSVVPYLWVFISSFKTTQEIFLSPFKMPGNWSFRNYVNAIDISKLHLMYINTIIISVMATVLSVIVYSMAAYALGRYSFPGGKIVFTVLISSILIPGNAMIQPIYAMIRQMGLYDTKTGLIIIYTAFGLPIILFVMKSYFQNLPKELEEAAEIEGASFPYIFLRIMLPLSKPAVACVTTLTFIGNWNEFLFAYLMSSSRNSRTLPVAIRYFVAEFAFDYAALYAAVIMVALPSMIVYFLMQNQIMESLVVGAVKG